VDGEDHKKQVSLQNSGGYHTNPESRSQLQRRTQATGVLPENHAWRKSGSFEGSRSGQKWHETSGLITGRAYDGIVHGIQMERASL